MSMTAPSFEDIKNLLTTGTCAMMANETIQSHEDAIFSYFYNYRGTETYWFVSIEHIMLFFYGTEEQKQKAHNMCRIEEIGEYEEGEEEQWNIIQEPNLPTLLCLFSRAAIDVHKSGGINSLYKSSIITMGEDWDIKQFANDKELTRYVDAMNDSNGWESPEYEELKMHTISVKHNTENSYHTFTVIDPDKLLRHEINQMCDAMNVKEVFVNSRLYKS